MSQPIMCSTCRITYHHEHPPTHCDRVVTGDELWRQYDQAKDRYLAQFSPRERHKHEQGWQAAVELIDRGNFGDQVWEEFRDARFRAGYRR